jgi:DNA-binding transcriptional LysR family regulator
MVGRHVRIERLLTEANSHHIIHDTSSGMSMPFDGRLLGGANVLAAVIDAGSFSRAGDALSISASGVSRAIARLETRIGVRLLDRTTRSVRLTDEGRRFYERVRPSLAAIEEAASEASGAADIVRGRLRANVDPLFSRVVLAGKLGGFIERHPDLELELITREHIGDLVGEGIDVAVRFGELADSALVARKLVDTRVITIASPAYLKKHGRPTHPNDLLKHACLQFRDPATGKPFQWEFHRRGKVLKVNPPSRILMSDASTMYFECLAGSAITQAVELGVRPLIAAGRLVDLFPDWPGETFPLHALYPSRRHQPAKVRAFVDFVMRAVR